MNLQYALYCFRRKYVPDPLSPGVQLWVLDMSMDIVRNLFLVMSVENYIGLPLDKIQQYGYPVLDYPAWVKEKRNSEVVAHVVNEVEINTDGRGLKILVIDIVSLDRGEQRVECRAQLLLGKDLPLEIRYSVERIDERLALDVRFLQWTF